MRFRRARIWLDEHPLPYPFPFAELVLSLLAATVVWAFVAGSVLHGRVTPHKLAISVAKESDLGVGWLAAEPFDCRPRATGMWGCSVLDMDGGSRGTYRVRTRPGSSCWDALLVYWDPESGSSRTISGRVHRWEWSLAWGF